MKLSDSYDSTGQQRAMPRTLSEYMECCSTKSDLSDALKPNPRNIRFTSANTSLADTLRTIISLTRHSIEQHQQPISIIQDFGTTLCFPDINDSSSTAGKIAILLSLARTIQSTLSTGQTRTIRDVYYSNVELYGSQRKVEYWLSSITRNLRLESRDCLHILPAQKGLCYTPCDIRIQTAGKETVIAAHTSSMVPYIARGSSVQILPPADQDLKLRLVVLEKEAVYHTVVKTCPPPNTIFVTGKGYPDFLSRLFLQLLERNDCIADWRLYTDADPHGIDIALKYMQNEDHKQYMCKSLVYKGALLTKLLKRRNVQFLQLNHRDISLAIGLIKRLSQPSSHPSNIGCLRVQLQRQMFFLKKAEMNSMAIDEYVL
ncbi:hypothetical protein HG536_0F03580 [Torulaspora globosa]|uniref:DNA topoisomerase (ATP-hydrolyzing) n=1 Tax=Torulaspora globosa TaxID=48254 RepID=A0A7G3ZKJ7_9SACH|nr:uncharacterized protein HG536_0F03580 [Torulaspora globosa]QLL34033.1 hypothetical protein HG536_0F03580 [Torulaspora globosa]